MSQKPKNTAPNKDSPPPAKKTVLDFHLDASKILIPAAEGGKANYSPLPLRNLTPGTKVPFNVYIKCKPKGSDHAEYFLCCSKGQVFKRDWHFKLERLKVPWVYFPLQETDAVLECLHLNLKDLSPKFLTADSETASQVMDAMLIWIQHFYLTETARTGPKLDMALDFIDMIFGFIKRSRASVSFLMEMHNHDDYLFRHCLNVCIIGLAFINYLGLSERKARDFGLGSLLHDVGMVQVPRHVLQKAGKLNDEDISIIRRHPQQSYSMLKNMPSIPRESILMVQQHHENGDGSGYPMGLTGSLTHPWAKIIRIVDSYESVTSGRPWRPATPPKETLWTMRHEWEESQVYDPAFLRAFIKFLGGAD